MQRVAHVHLKNVRPVPALQDATLRFADDAVRVIRLGRHPQNTTRLVVDLDGVGSYTVYPLYGPYRLVVDFRRAATTAPATATTNGDEPISTDGGLKQFYTSMVGKKNAKTVDNALQHSEAQLLAITDALDASASRIQAKICGLSTPEAVSAALASRRLGKATAPGPTRASSALVMRSARTSISA